MKIIKKIADNNRDNTKNPPVTIAFLGDSVTQGCFRTHTDCNAVYHRLVAESLNTLFPSAIINIINAGIGGTTADFAVERLERDVISKNPDLCVVCFGLNDVGGLEEGLLKYETSLKSIFNSLKQSGCEVIFMTPNMLNTAITDIIPTQHKDYAEVTQKWQNNGLMDKYMETAKKTALECGIPVCDCYARWKKLALAGADTNLLLSNGINHPTREMHKLFSISLLETMFS